MPLTQPPVVKTQMLIRRPAAEVYEAFVDPAITTKFWFTKSSGRLEPSGTAKWEWEMYGVSTQVRVMALEPGRRIAIEWDDPPCPVEWNFTARPDNTTLVTITNCGFAGTDDQQVTAAIDSMGGFCFLLAALKAYLEHGIQLNLVADHHPNAHVTPTVRGE